MKSKLRSVRLTETEPPEKPQIEASWLNPLWRYDSIHTHTLDSFRKRMEERKHRQETTK